MRVLSVFKTASGNPVEAIESLIAATMLLVGFYIASPWYVSTSGTALGAAFQENMMQHLLVGLVFFILPALPIVLGLFNSRFHTKRWRAISTFSMFFGLFFLTLLRIIAVGPLPVTWVFSMALSLVSAICFLSLRRKV